jgi:hypothetical protein
MILTRTRKCSEGVFGALSRDDGTHFCYTGEHAYPVGNGFEPKIPTGKYLCVRGVHRLEDMIHAFEAFEITGVPGHSGLLFHSGNFPQEDSCGCVLLGNRIDGHMITNSRNTFNSFMALLNGINQFDLSVV